MREISSRWDLSAGCLASSIKSRPRAHSRRRTDSRTEALATFEKVLRLCWVKRPLASQMSAARETAARGCLSRHLKNVVHICAYLGVEEDEAQSPSSADSQEGRGVYVDMELGTEVRRRVLTGELSERAACREYNFTWGVLEKDVGS